MHLLLNSLSVGYSFRLLSAYSIRSSVSPLHPQSPSNASNESNYYDITCNHRLYLGEISIPHAFNQLAPVCGKISDRFSSTIQEQHSSVQSFKKSQTPLVVRDEVIIPQQCSSHITVPAHFLPRSRVHLNHHRPTGVPLLERPPLQDTAILPFCLPPHLARTLVLLVSPPWWKRNNHLIEK